ncbi:TPA: class II lanthipeptide, LchA2/BrtA2 family [Streptococcus equi subsp. zooepidemicus]|uniref:class II lanthipeptide, LchA2/BrtA2 family n=1 Tax=Streptococcus TaxID=1301 RepID=UPI0012F325B7|nr:MULTISPECIES: class II lanthipeptide, LchA2/BrtA2 family [Streptococcus]MCD3405222.1 class II lanthipeptide, LchA2/BrtA2 family [Streptococcus equi subsp. zooepidemicus]MCD3459489.1 class II lanthipeptide, LchA2/BrtA2 family [Streptococcus equi subsp. zooepidemicus]MDI5902060.1 class II lanthipeptide, LchA2/BrtA2 family [Streptococcus equi subsp. zooepidemicus]MDI5930764.1 class II lanthipeptide, LchA2/BrtA2 family [Streptococcus equi subsp. zooepidemicus]MDI6030033.1 class II lanthipeptide
MEQNNLELGKYLESDLLSLTDENVDGGTTPASPATPYTPAIGKGVIAVTAFVSANTCPTSACTRAC